MGVVNNQQSQFHYVLQGDWTTSRLCNRHQPILLFLHGFMGDCHDFAQVISHLNLTEFCCLMVDLPGHGRTTVQQDSDYQIPNIAEALIRLLVELVVKQCIVVGYSMGGRIALYLVTHFPQYFLGGIIESASPGLANQLERDRRIVRDAKLATQLESENFADFLQQWYEQPLFTSFAQHPNYSQAIARRLTNDPKQLAKSLRFTGLGAQSPLWHILAEVQIPLLLICGELDPKFLTINQMVANSCHRAKIQLVKGAGHNIHFEAPAQFSHLLKQFVASFKLSGK